ncbi:MAG TPA: cysteine--tRNA ligase [Clostridia bacterium]
MRLYNTLVREKQEFVPLEPGRIRMYACGPTVYNFIHIGNARAFVTFDTLRRFLEYRGYQVDFVQNFTDVDDKMIQRAQSEDITVSELATRFIAEYYQDADGLGIRRATAQPRATEAMDDIISLISVLMERGYAYETADGVYFDVSRDEDYGKLSRHNLDDLKAGAGERIMVDEAKRNPMDFALWKKKKPGEPAWNSPWGEGRPGWHIECSAMIRKTLGDTIDIHCGGQDLVFPHHENEIAQSESATGKPFVRYWVHNGFITVDDEKMSKSIGNFFTVRDIVGRFPYAVIRFFLLSAHYRMPINYSLELMTAAQSGWQRIRNCVESLDFKSGSAASGDPGHVASRALAETCGMRKNDFVAALEDDLNTADALASVFDLVRAANTAAADPDTASAVLAEAARMIRELCDVLGIDLSTAGGEPPADVMDIVEARLMAKKNRDFTLADQLRDQVRDRGYLIEDTSQGPRVIRA